MLTVVQVMFLHSVTDPPPLFTVDAVYNVIRNVSRKNRRWFSEELIGYNDTVKVEVRKC